MKKFRDWLIKEDHDQHLVDARYKNPIEDINIELSKATAQLFLTPYIALESISKVLARYSILLPKYGIMDPEGSERDIKVFNANESPFSQSINGDFQSNESSPLYLHFAYATTDTGYVEVFAELTYDPSEFAHEDNGHLEID